MADEFKFRDLGRQNVKRVAIASASKYGYVSDRGMIFCKNPSQPLIAAGTVHLFQNGRWVDLPGEGAADLSLSTDGEMWMVNRVGNIYCWFVR